MMSFFGVGWGGEIEKGLETLIFWSSLKLTHQV